MKLDSLRNSSEEIVRCKVKDEQGLNDFQKTPSKSSIAINEVGIERFRIPLKFKHSDGEVMSHDCEASMSIYLDETKNGANMSRFCHILQEMSGTMAIDNNFFKDILYRYRRDLRDFDDEDLIPESKLHLKLSYPLRQKSLKSDNWGWQYYDIELKGLQSKTESSLEITLNYEYSSTCPCSLSMSKQYEKDYEDGVTKEGSGIASAHSQRSVATITVKTSCDTDFCIEDLIMIARKAIPTETQSLVKRIDEQAFAILNGDNPMFVEHSSRRLSVVLDEDKRILDWSVKVRHLESLHSHDAVAVIRKVNEVKDSFLQ